MDLARSSKLRAQADMAPESGPARAVGTPHLLRTLNARAGNAAVARMLHDAAPGPTIQRPTVVLQRLLDPTRLIRTALPPPTLRPAYTRLTDAVFAYNSACEGTTIGANLIQNAFKAHADHLLLPVTNEARAYKQQDPNAKHVETFLGTEVARESTLTRPMDRR